MGLTMVLAVSSDTQSPCLYCGEAETDGLAQCGGVYVWDAILVADSAIGKVEALAGDITIWIGRIISRQPEKKVVRGLKLTVRRELNRPSLHENLLCPV